MFVLWIKIIIFGNQISYNFTLTIERMRKLLQSLALTAGFLIAVPSVVMAQLSGTYTIDPNGSGTTNYTSYTAALSALSTSGVNGPVVFNVLQAPIRSRSRSKVIPASAM